MSADKRHRIVVGVALLLAALWWWVPGSAPDGRVGMVAAGDAHDGVVAVAPPANLPSVDSDPDPDRPQDDTAQTVSCQGAFRLGVFKDFVLTEWDPDTLQPIGPIHMDWDEHWVSFQPRHAEGLGVLTSRRFKPTAVGWLDGACLDLIAPEGRPLAEAVVHADGEVVTDTQVLTRCAGVTLYGRLGPRGQRLTLDRSGPCEVYLRMPFGGRYLEGERVTFQFDMDTPVDVVLPLPEPPPGSAGWDLTNFEAGLHVVEVFPGSLADRAGLRPGDLVLEVDGEAAAALDAEALFAGEAPHKVAWDRDGRWMEAVLR